MLNKNKNKLKGVWDILNNQRKGGAKKMIYPEYFTDNQGDTYHRIKVVNSMNDFFVNVGPELARNISDQGSETMSENLMKNHPDSIFLSAVDKLEIKSVVIECNNKISTDRDY